MSTEIETVETDVSLARLNPEFVISLKGKQYPLWAGVLDLAMQTGLKLLTTRVVQIPSAENGHLAVVMATATFEDGRTFTDVGDCSPHSTSAQLAPAALRLASTRAKGRVLRDSLSIGQTMFEELGDLDDAPRQQQQRPASNGQQQRVHQAQPAADTAICSEPGCGVILTKNQATMSSHHAQCYLCPDHLKARTSTKKP
jgi:hypothetical protein